MRALPDLLPAVLDALPGFAGLLGPDGVITEINRFALDLTGLEAAVVRGVPLADAPWWSALPRARERVHAAVGRAAGGEAMRIETELGLTDGRVLPIDLSIVPLCGAQGRVTGLVVAAVDLSERRHSEAMLARQVAERGAAVAEGERRFERLVQGVTDYGIIMLDPRGRVSSWNAGAARIKGYTAEEILGQSFECFFTEEDRAAGLPARTLAEAARVGRHESEGWRLRHDGTRFWALSVVHAITDEEGRPAGFAKITRDITARRDMQHHLMQAQKMEAIGQLTGGIAHDFNNLLQAVSSNLELARSAVAQGGAGRADRLIGNALRAIGRAGRLTSQLLAFSRRQILRTERSRVSDVAADMPDVLHGASGEAVRVETHTEPGLWSCRIDPGEFESALLNLMLNARDAMPQGGTVTVSMTNARLGPAEAKALELAPGDYVRVDVADTGAGMSPEILAHAFEPYFTTKDVGKGSGLGLSQVLGFTKQSGGSLVVDSRPGRGTTVSLLFPRDDGSEPAETPRRMATLAEGRESV